MKNSTGTTLIELLMSLLLGVLIIGILTPIYLAMEKYYMSQTALMTLTEHMRIAEQYFTTVVRSASYQGCLKSKNITIKPYFDVDMKAGTNAFVIDYVETLNNDLIADMQDKKTLYVTLDDGLAKNDEVLISDCESIDKAFIANVYKNSNAQKIIIQNPLHKIYKKYAEISRINHAAYYIAQTDRFDNKHNPVYALYMKNRNSKKIEIMEGVSDMKILYSTIENNHMVERETLQLENNTNLVGVMLDMQHSSTINSKLHQQQYIYVAL